LCRIVGCGGSLSNTIRKKSIFKLIIRVTKKEEKRNINNHKPETKVANIGN
jgi:hypothetical protein